MTAKIFTSWFVIVALACGTRVCADTPITPAEALNSIGKPCIVVEMTVRQAKNRLERRGVIYLDSEDDFMNPANLGIAITAGAAESYRKLGIEDPAPHFLGKTIRVQGAVMRLEERAYLPVLDPSQISLVNEGP